MKLLAVRAAQRTLSYVYSNHCNREPWENNPEFSKIGTTWIQVHQYLIGSRIEIDKILWACISFRLACRDRIGKELLNGL